MPQPGPQTEAIVAKWCDELLYGGAAGGGKSDFLLADYLHDVFRYGSDWQGVLFRRTTGELEELVARSKELYPATGATWFEQKHTWKWPNGASLKMRHLEREMDCTRYQGHQYAWIGWDELTQWPSPYAYRYLRGRLRSPNAVKTKRIRAACNPGGVGHHWVKEYFVDPAPLGFMPIDDPETGGRRMFIPAKVSDNKILLQNDPGYIGRLKGLGSPTLVKALLDGDWSVVEGAFFPEWSNEKHVIAPFAVPASWTRFRSADWGSARPFSIGWWAVVGDEYRERPGQVALPRGAIVRYRELYGASSPNVGLRLPAEQVADRIKALEINEPKDIHGDSSIAYGVMDPAAFASDGGPSIAERFAHRGVFFRRADNARVGKRGAMGGWDQLRARLIGDGERPMIYFFSTCKDAIRTIPMLQHDTAKPEDVDTEAEDHAGDDVRYACMSRPYVTDVPEAKKPKTVVVGAPSTMTLDDLWEAQEPKRHSGRI